jgi:hypothetical protein
MVYGGFGNQVGRQAGMKENRRSVIAKRERQEKEDTRQARISGYENLADWRNATKFTGTFARELKGKSRDPQQVKAGTKAQSEVLRGRNGAKVEPYNGSLELYNPPIIPGYARSKAAPARSNETWRTKKAGVDWNQQLATERQAGK